jgi:phage-related protein
LRSKYPAPTTNLQGFVSAPPKLRDRVFYVLWNPAELVLLYAYRKQTQKAPARHVEIAQRRMQEVLRCREDTSQ